MPIPSLRAPNPIIYPDCDGEPIAENTLQFEYIVTIKEGLDWEFRDEDDVFVAGDLFWYPQEGHPEIRTAPDTLVVFGRPKEHRLSYRQWEEGDIAPQVTFEVLSPSNRAGALSIKFNFYERYGVAEYYIFDPDHGTLEGWLRADGRLQQIADMNGWVSPRMGVRFELVNGELQLFGRDGKPFLSYAQLAAQRDRAEQGLEEERRRAERERQGREQAQQRAEQERLRAEQERLRAEQLAARLRALGEEV